MSRRYELQLKSFLDLKNIEDYNKSGYHKRNIVKGFIGESSKILEEVLEFIDANEQGAKVMELVELSDLIGAIKLYLRNNHPNITLTDLENMSIITERAFKHGHRT